MLMTIQQIEEMSRKVQSKGGELIICGDSRELVARFPFSPDNPFMVDCYAIEAQF